MEQNTGNYVPVNYPKDISGKLTTKVKLKRDYVRKDGTCAIFIQVFLDKERKRIPLDISVKPKEFDDKKQRVKGNSQIAKDYNLLIGQKLSDINKIAVNYRLAEIYLSLDKLVEELNNPSSKTDFLIFYENELENQLGLIGKSTYLQQKSTLKKLRKFRDKIFFQDIDEDLITEYRKFERVTLKNTDVTLQTSLKNIKKYLHLANKKGIKTKLTYDKIKVKRMVGNRTFLEPSEIKLLDEYWSSKFVSPKHKNVLSRFLFSCFTGLRISDIQNLTVDNLIGDFIALSLKSVKTKKFLKIKLNKSARKYINEEENNLFVGTYSDQKINEYLKEIAKVCGITKLLTFHVGRHTFATNFLIMGGRVENLQRILDHSQIKDTMVYVHIVDSIMNDDIDNMDSILSLE
jgi:integrase